LAYFARGRLPWQGIQNENKAMKYAEIGRIKKETPIEKIVEGMGVGERIFVVMFRGYC
jgi:hypothetical protein